MLAAKMANINATVNDAHSAAPTGFGVDEVAPAGAGQLRLKSFFGPAHAASHQPEELDDPIDNDELPAAAAAVSAVGASEVIEISDDDASGGGAGGGKYVLEVLRPTSDASRTRPQAPSARPAASPTIIDLVDSEPE